MNCVIYFTSLAVAYEYEPYRDLKTLVSNAWGTNVISTFAYTYDAIGRRTVRIDDGTTTNLFGYNLRSELTTAHMSTNLYAYTYDPIGNRLSSTENGLATTYAANALNQYTALNPASPNPTPFTYDADGNMTQYGDLSFFWDAENRLLGVASNDTFLVTNRYDFMGRRVEKSSAASTNSFLYDGWNLICETIDSTLSCTTNHYVWGLDLSCTFQGAGGIGGLLLQYSSLANDSLCPFCDANGNIGMWLYGLTNCVSHCDYSPSGSMKSRLLCMHPLISFYFSSKYYDFEIDMSYYGYRYFDSSHGAWINRDPAAEKAFSVMTSKSISSRTYLNVYNYDNNRLINASDFLGLTEIIDFHPFCGSRQIRSGVYSLTIDDGQNGKVLLHRITMKDVEDEMQYLIGQLCRFELKDGTRSRLHEVRFDSKYFEGEKAQHQYYLVDENCPVWADNEINYIAIGLYEAWLSTPMTKAKKIVNKWKKWRWWTSPTDGTMYWLQVGYDRYNDVLKEWESEDDCCPSSGQN